MSNNARRVTDGLAATGGKDKSHGAVSRAFYAVLLLGGLLAGGAEDVLALSGSCGPGNATNITTTINGTCTATSADVITLSSSGTIQAGVSFGTIYLDTSANAVVIDNGGSILNTTLPAIDLDASATNTVITNQPGALISATANQAIFYHGSLDNTLTNTGTIQVNGTNASAATGIEISADLSGTLTNTGTISALASKANAAGASAYGLRISNMLSGTLTNTINISASATLSGSIGANINVNAYGVSIGTSLSKKLTNDGTISVTGTNNANETGGNISTSTYGVSVGALSNKLTNNGTISATANNTGNDTANPGNISVTSYGVSASTLSGTLTNGGTTISGTATNSGNASSGSINVIAYSMQTGTLSGTLTNSRAINATASNTGNASSSITVSTYGVDVGTLSGTLTNSSTITAEATNSGTGSTSNVSAAGVRIGTMAAGGVLSNSSTISATSSTGVANAYSLRVLASTGGSISNLTGGLLRGNLSIAGAAIVNNAGTIEIPDGVTGSIAGNYTQQAGGKLRIGASSAASFGKLTVGGTADLTASGAFDVNVAGINSLAGGNKLIGVLTAGTLNTGTITVTDNSLLFDFTGSVDAAGTGIDLTIAGGGSGVNPNTVLGSVLATKFTPGTGAAVVYDNMIAGASASVDMANVVTALGKLSTQQQVSNAVEQSVPLLTGGVQLAGLDITRAISQTLKLQMAGMQGMASGDGFFGSGKLWIKPFGGIVRQGDRTGASGFDANTFGLMVGTDKDISDTTSLGMAFGWGRSLLDSNNNFHSADINAFNLAVSGIYHVDADTFLRFAANGGINQNDGQRTIVFGGLSRLATSSYNSWTAHGGVEAGRSFAMGGKLSLTPSLRMDYAVIHDNSYSETGADALNLIVGSNTTDELLLGGDVKLGYALTDTAMFAASVGGAYDALQKQALITSSFAGVPGTAFTTAGINPPRWLGRDGASLSFKAVGNINVIAAYDGELRKNFFNQTGSIKLVMAF